MSNISHLSTSVIFENKTYHINFDVNEALLPQKEKEKAREEILSKVETLVMAHLVAQAQSQSNRAESAPTHFTLDKDGAHFGSRVTPHASVNLQPAIDYTKTQSTSSLERFQKVFDETLKSRNNTEKYRFDKTAKDNKNLKAQDLWAFISNKKDGYTPLPSKISEDEDSDDDEEDFDSIHTPSSRSRASSVSSSSIIDVNLSDLEEDEDGLPDDESGLP